MVNQRKDHAARSPTIRKLLNSKPHVVIRWGSAAILLLLFLLLGLSWFVPYPEVVTGSLVIEGGRIEPHREVKVAIAFPHISRVEPGQEVSLRLDGTSGTYAGEVAAIGEEVNADQQGETPYYLVEIQLLGRSPGPGNEIRGGRASIVTDDLRLFERIFGKIRSQIAR